MSEQAKHTIRGYELQEIIGEGGFGAVYRAYQPVVDRDVAIKVILPKYSNDPDFIRNFEIEARLVARLENPFIVPLYDYWRDPEGAYLVMRYFGKGSLQQRLREKRRIEPAVTAKIIEQLGSALDTAHHYHVIHRDIKPANILLDDADNAYLTDFGIARQIDEETTGVQEEVSGTIAYLSPEVLEGGTTSRQSDVYALGLVTYEMLAGKHPFAVDSVLKMMHAHIQEELPPIEDLSESVNAVLIRAAAKKSEDRFATASEMAEALTFAVHAEDSTEQKASSTRHQVHRLINPYKGLRPFAEADARDFFGREKLVEELLDQFRGNDPWRKFLAVVGPSGSGKSSVVHAGLLPQLRQGQPTGAENWYIVNMVPGNNPLQQLKTSLLSVAINPADTMTNQLQNDSQGLIQAVNNVLGEQDNLLLVIDQFEEVFTLVDNEHERQQFLDLLYNAVNSEDLHLWVIITLRADFYDKPLLYEKFGALIQSRTQVVLPLSSEELERAITGPAKQVGLEVDTDLVAAIIADVREEPGALPLLQYALTEVFAKRTGNRLNLEAYQASGGVLGALARRAEEVYQDLSKEQKALAEQIFLRLVSLGEGTEDTRRRALYSELTNLSTSTELLQSVLDAFGQYRLLTFDRDYNTREPTVEVAHEALLREWGRLQEWLDNNRHDIRLQRMLDAAAVDWQMAKMDKSYLLSGARLSQFSEWADTSSLILSQREVVFLEASLAEQRRQQEFEVQRQAEQLKLEQRARQRLQWIVGILVVASIIGAFLTVAVYQQSQTAERERDSAEDAREAAELARDEAVSARATSEAIAEEARSLALSTQAQQAVGRGNPSLALLLAIEATEIDNPPLEVYETLLDIAYAPGIRHLKDVYQEPVAAVAISADGKFAVTGAGLDLLNNIEEAQEGERPRPGSGGPPPGGPPDGGPPPDGNPPNGGSPDDNATDSDSSESEPKLPSEIFGIAPELDEMVGDYDLVIWDLDTGEEIRRLTGHTSPISSVLFPQIDGQLQVISVAFDGVVIIWDAATGEQLNSFTLAEGIHLKLSLDANQTYLLATSNANPNHFGEMVVWDIANQAEVQRLVPDENGFWEGHLTADGTRIVASYWEGIQIVLDVATGEIVGRLNIESNGLPPNAYHTTVSMNSDLVATSGPNNEILVWDSVTFEPIDRLIPPYTNIATIKFVEDGAILYGTSTDGHLTTWDMDTLAQLGEFSETNNSHVVDFDLTDNIQTGIMGMSDGKIQIWNLSPLPPGQVAAMTEQDLVNRAQFLPATADQPLRVVSIGGDWDNFTMVPEVLVWDAFTGKVLQHFGTGIHTYMGNSLDVSPDYQWVLTGTSSSQPGLPQKPEPNRMILWDLATGEVVRQFDFPPNVDVESIAFDPTSGTVDKPLIAATNWGSDIRLWNIETGEVIRDFTGHTRIVHDVAITSDGERIMGISDEGILRIWDIATGDELEAFTMPDNGRFFELSPDDQRIALNARDSQVFLLDVNTGEVVYELVGHDERVDSLSFSHDGRYLLTGSDDTTMILWDVATGNLVRRIEGNYGRVWNVAFSPDDKYILSNSQADDPIVWETFPPPLDEIIQWVRDNRYLREFSTNECITYRLDCETPEDD